jgi:hypothetical protein
MIKKLSQKHEIDLLALTDPSDVNKSTISELAKYCHRIEIISKNRAGQLWKRFLLFRNLSLFYHEELIITDEKDIISTSSRKVL